MGEGGFDGVVPHAPSSPQQRRGSDNARSLRNRLQFNGRHVVQAAQELRRPAEKTEAGSVAEATVDQHVGGFSLDDMSTMQSTYEQNDGKSYYEEGEKRLPRIDAGSRRRRDDESMSASFSGESTYLYLQRTSATNPYALQLADHRSGDFYLSSAQGLVHTERGLAEFTSREEYAREARLYGELVKIPFFALYRRWRFFVLWHRGTVLRSRLRRRKALSAELFILHSRHRDCLLRLRRECCALWDQRLFDVSTEVDEYDVAVEEELTLQDFQERQTRRRAEVAEELAKTLRRAHALVLHCCEDSLQTFLAHCGFGLTSASGEYTRRAAMRAHCLKLVRFVRLADMQLLETKIHIAHFSMSDLLEAAENADAGTSAARHLTSELQARDLAASRASSPDSAKATAAALHAYETKTDCADAVFHAVVGDVDLASQDDDDSATSALLRVSVVWDDGLSAWPDRGELVGRLESIVTEALSSVGAPTNLLGEAQFAPFVIAALDESHADASKKAASLSTILEQDAVFVELQRRLRECLEKASEAALVYARGFQRFLTAQKEHLEFLEHAPTEVTVRDLERMLARYMAENAVFELLPRRMRLGLLVVDSSQLCDRLTPSPLACLEAARGLAPDLYNSRASLLLAELAVHNEALSIHLSSVDEYVVLTETLRRAQRVLPSAHRATELLATLKSLVLAYGAAIPESMQDAAVLLTNLDAAVRSAVIKAGGLVQDNEAKFCEELEVMVKKVVEPTKVAKNSLEADFLGGPSQDPTEALSRLQTVADTVRILIEKTALVRRYQATLNQELTDPTELAAVADKLGALTQLWGAAESWRGLTGGWIAKKCADLDPTVLSQAVSEHSALLKEALSALPSNEAAAAYVAISEDFREVVALIAELKSAHMERRHFEAVEQVLGIKVVDDDKLVLCVTLGDLMPRIKAKDAVAAIARRARREAELNGSIKAIQTKWATIDLKFAPQAPQRSSGAVLSLVQFNDLAALASDLDCDGSKAATLLKSSADASAGIRQGVAEWRSLLERASAILCRLRDFQTQLGRVHRLVYGGGNGKAEGAPREVFGDAHFGAEADFKAAEDFWRSLCAAVLEAPLAIEVEKKALLAGMPAVATGLERAVLAMRETVASRRALYPRLWLCCEQDVIAASVKSTSNYGPLAPSAAVLRRCFGLSRVELGSRLTKEVVLVAVDGDRLSLQGVSDYFKARAPLHDWLAQLEKSMRVAISESLQEGLKLADEVERREAREALVAKKRAFKDEKPASSSSSAAVGEPADNEDLNLTLEGHDDDDDDAERPGAWAEKVPLQCVEVVSSVVFGRQVDQALAQLGGEENQAAALALKTLLTRRVSSMAAVAVSLASASLTPKERSASIAVFTAQARCVEILENLLSSIAKEFSPLAWHCALKYSLPAEAADEQKHDDPKLKGDSKPPKMGIMLGGSKQKSSASSSSKRLLNEDEDDEDDLEHASIALTARVGPYAAPYGLEYTAARRCLITPATERCWLGLLRAFGDLRGGFSATGGAASRDLADALGEPWFQVDCSDANNFLPFGVSAALNLAQSSMTQKCWLCLERVDTMATSQLATLADAILRVSREARLSGGDCPRFVANCGLSCSAWRPTSEALKRAFRPLTLSKPEMDRSAALALRDAGCFAATDQGEIFEVARRAATLWRFLHGNTTTLSAVLRSLQKDVSAASLMRRLVDRALELKLLKAARPELETMAKQIMGADLAPSFDDDDDDDVVVVVVEEQKKNNSKRESDLTVLQTALRAAEYDSSVTQAFAKEARRLASGFQAAARSQLRLCVTGRRLKSTMAFSAAALEAFDNASTNPSVRGQQPELAPLCSLVTVGAMDAKTAWGSFRDGSEPREWTEGLLPPFLTLSNGQIAGEAQMGIQKALEPLTLVALTEMAALGMGQKSTGRSVVLDVDSAVELEPLFFDDDILLPNNARCRCKQQVLLECADLSQASPATACKLLVVHLDADLLIPDFFGDVAVPAAIRALPWLPEKYLRDRWLICWRLFKKPGSSLKMMMMDVEIFAKSLLALFVHSCSKFEGDKAVLASQTPCLDAILAFAALWALAGHLEDRRAVEENVRAEFPGCLPANNIFNVRPVVRLVAKEEEPDALVEQKKESVTTTRINTDSLFAVADAVEEVSTMQAQLSELCFSSTEGGGPQEAFFETVSSTVEEALTASLSLEEASVAPLLEVEWRPFFKEPSSAAVFALTDVIIETPSMCQAAFLGGAYLAQRRHCELQGPKGCGKSTVGRFVGNDAFLRLNAASEPAAMRRSVDRQVRFSEKGAVVLFVEDLSAGSTAPLELVRSLAETKLTLLAATRAPTTGRLHRHFGSLRLADATAADLATCFSSSSLPSCAATLALGVTQITIGAALELARLKDGDWLSVAMKVAPHAAAAAAALEIAENHFESVEVSSLTDRLEGGGNVLLLTDYSDPPPLFNKDAFFLEADEEASWELACFKSVRAALTAENDDGGVVVISDERLFFKGAEEAERALNKVCGLLEALLLGSSEETLYDLFGDECPAAEAEAALKAAMLVIEIKDHGGSLSGSSEKVEKVYVEALLTAPRKGVKIALVFKPENALKIARGFPSLYAALTLVDETHDLDEYETDDEEVAVASSHSLAPAAFEVLPPAVAFPERYGGAFGLALEAALAVVDADAALVKSAYTMMDADMTAKRAHLAKRAEKLIQAVSTANALGTALESLSSKAEDEETSKALSGIRSVMASSSTKWELELNKAQALTSGDITAEGPQKLFSETALAVFDATLGASATLAKRVELLKRARAVLGGAQGDGWLVGGVRVNAGECPCASVLRSDAFAALGAAYLRLKPTGGALLLLVDPDSLARRWLQKKISESEDEESYSPATLQDLRNALKKKKQQQQQKKIVLLDAVLEDAKWPAVSQVLLLAAAEDQLAETHLVLLDVDLLPATKPRVFNFSLGDDPVSELVLRHEFLLAISPDREDLERRADVTDSATAAARTALEAFEALLATDPGADDLHLLAKNLKDAQEDLALLEPVVTPTHLRERAAVLAAAHRVFSRAVCGGSLDLALTVEAAGDQPIANLAKAVQRTGADVGKFLAELAPRLQTLKAELGIETPIIPSPPPVDASLEARLSALIKASPAPACVLVDAPADLFEEKETKQGKKIQFRCLDVFLAPSAFREALQDLVLYFEDLDEEEDVSLVVAVLCGGKALPRTHAEIISEEALTMPEGHVDEKKQRGLAIVIQSPKPLPGPLGRRSWKLQIGVQKLPSLRTPESLLPIDTLASLDRASFDLLAAEIALEEAVIDEEDVQVLITVPQFEEEEEEEDEEEEEIEIPPMSRQWLALTREAEKCNSQKCSFARAAYLSRFFTGGNRARVSGLLVREIDLSLLWDPALFLEATLLDMAAESTGSRGEIGLGSLHWVASFDDDSEDSLLVRGLTLLNGEWDGHAVRLASGSNNNKAPDLRFKLTPLRDLPGPSNPAASPPRGETFLAPLFAGREPILAVHLPLLPGVTTTECLDCSLALIISTPVQKVTKMKKMMKKKKKKPVVKEIVKKKSMLANTSSRRVVGGSGN